MPSATLTPRSMTAIRSASWSASSRYCVVSSTVHPLATRSRMVSHIWPAGARVEARGRLVEEDQGWPGDQAGGQVEAPPHAAGERRDRLAGGLGQVELLQQARRGLAGGRLGDALEPREEHEVLGGGEVLVDRRVLPGHAEQLPDDVRLTADVVAEDLAATAVDRQQRGEHLQHGGLAGTVGAEDAEDLAAVDLEVDVVDRAVVSEVLDQALGPDCECGLVHGSSVGEGGYTAVSPGRAAATPRGVRENADETEGHAVRTTRFVRVFRRHRRR